MLEKVSLKWRSDISVAVVNNLSKTNFKSVISRLCRLELIRAEPEWSGWYGP